MTSRRAFLLGATAFLAAPAVVRASSLMKLYVPKQELLTAESLERVIMSLPRGSLKLGYVAYIASRGLVPLQVMDDNTFKMVLQPGGDWRVA